MKNYTKNELRNAVYKHIAEHNYVSLQEIANALRIENGESLWTIVEELRSEFYIVLNPIPLTIGDNNSSYRFTATKKEYEPKGN